MDATTEEKMRLIWGKRYPHFTPEEILSPGQMKLFRRGILPISAKAIDILEEFRAYLCKSLAQNIRLYCNGGGHKRRGARSISEVISINTFLKLKLPTRFSFHLWCAFDVSSNQISNDYLAELAIRFGKFGGVGRYPSFVHLDCRDNLLGEVTTWGG